MGDFALALAQKKNRPRQQLSYLGRGYVEWNGSIGAGLVRRQRSRNLASNVDHLDG